MSLNCNRKIIIISAGVTHTTKSFVRSLDVWFYNICILKVWTNPVSYGTVLKFHWMTEYSKKHLTE